MIAIIAALRPRHPIASRSCSKAAYNSQVIPDQTSLGSQLQNLPQTDLAYTKPVISPMVSMVNPTTMQAYPVVSSSSRDGRRLKKNRGFLFLSRVPGQDIKFPRRRPGQMTLHR